MYTPGIEKVYILMPGVSKISRINSRFETTIKCAPIEALLQLDGNTLKVVLDRIKAAAKKRMAGARFDLKLPGFSPHK